MTLAISGTAGTPAGGTITINEPAPPFLLLDTYEGDAERPDFAKLVEPFIGVILKATEGVHYAPDWFVDEWRAAREANPIRYGSTWFRGAYHFLRMTGDGAAQADYFLAHVERAGGWGAGDLIPIVDVERADNRGATASAVIDTTSAYSERIHEVTGRWCAQYGRGLMRDLGIRDRMGCDVAICPAYTAEIVTHGLEAFLPDRIPLWQYADGAGQGDASRHHLPLRGPIRGDLNVVIDGPRRPTLARFREMMVDGTVRPSPIAPARG